MSVNVDSAQNFSKDRSGEKAAGAFRTISEVAKELGVQHHVLRFWETKFSQVKPLTRGGGRRYYRPEDVGVLKAVHHILYSEGYTIKGAQNLLKGLSKNQIIALEYKKPSHGHVGSSDAVNNVPSTDMASTSHANNDVAHSLTAEKKEALKEVLSDLMLIKNAFGG